MKNIKLKILALCAVAMMVVGCSKPDYSDKKELKLLVVGDSLSAAYQIDPKKSWTKLIQDKFDENALNVKLVNISKSGDRTSDALDKHDKHLEVEADIVLMNIGANDALKKVPINQTKANYKEMIESFQASPSKPEIVMVNIQPPSSIIKVAPFLKSYTTIVPELAGQYNISYIKDLFEDLDSGLISNKHFLGDKIHPNEAAQPILANTIYDALLPAIKTKHGQ